MPAVVVRQLVRRDVLPLERAQARAVERGAEARLGDAVSVRDEPVGRLGEELAAVVCGFDVRDEERAAGLEEGGEEARRVVDRGEVVERCAALRIKIGERGMGSEVKRSMGGGRA